MLERLERLKRHCDRYFKPGYDLLGESTNSDSAGGFLVARAGIRGAICGV